MGNLVPRRRDDLAAVRGPFPGYALSNMLRTSGGALLVVGRLPSMCLRCSFDDGHTWDAGTVIDGSIWCMGCMCEVEPDLVLYCYWDSHGGMMRSQRLSVRSGRVERRSSDWHTLLVGAGISLS